MFQRVFLATLFALTYGCSGGWWESDCDENLPDGVPNSCPDPDAEDGTSQGKCRPSTTGQMCDPGLSCITGVCLPCGADGELCCFNGVNTPDSCDPGVACGENIAEQWPKCTNDCGVPGMPCCDIDFDPCPGGGSCNGANQCEGSSTDECKQGPVHFVWIKNEFECAIHAQTFQAMPGNEQTCAQAVLAFEPAGSTLGPIDIDPNCEPVCIVPGMNAPNPWNPMCWFDPADFDTCAKSDCIFDDECTWHLGSCP